MLRFPRFAPPETLRVLACFRTLKLGMLRIPRFAPPETLRVLALFAPSNSECFASLVLRRPRRFASWPASAPANSECFAFLVLRGPRRFASWPPCANPQKTSGEQALRPAFADLRRVLAIIRLYHFPDIVYNRNRAPLFGVRPTRSASAPREQGNSQLTLHFSVQHLSHFRYARSGSGKQAFSVYYHQQSLPIYTESPQTNG